MLSPEAQTLRVQNISEWTAMRRLAVVIVVALVLLVPVAIRANPLHAKRPPVCTMALAIAHVDNGEVIGAEQFAPGVEVALEDQGRPGRGACDLKSWSYYDRVLGFNCKVYFGASRTVLEHVKPNRSDGTCGQVDAVPTTTTP